jgi:ATP-dependent DNA helicase RecQ
MLGYATSEDKCRSRILLEYFGEKGTASCGSCDVCVAERSAGKRPPVDAPAEWVMRLLADGNLHAIGELDAMRLPRKEMEELLRSLCDEEKICIQGNNIKQNK